MRRFFIFFFLFACLSSSVSALTLQEEVEQVILYYQDGATNKALNLAKTLVASKELMQDKPLLGRFYLYLGIIFYEENKKSLASQAFLKAFHFAPHLHVKKEQKPFIHDFIEKMRQKEKFRTHFSHPTLTQPIESAPSAKQTMRSSAWVLAVCTVVFASVGIVTGLQAQNFHERSLAFVKEAKLAEKPWPEPLVRRHIDDNLTPQMQTNSLVANISFGLAGASAIASTTLFILSAFNKKRDSSLALFSAPSQTTWSQQHRKNSTSMIRLWTEE